MRNNRLNTVLIVTALLIIALPLLLRSSPEYGGTDSQAIDVVAQIDPDYQPWILPLVQLPGSEIESLLFAFQAALGAGGLGFVFGRLTAPKQSSPGQSPQADKSS